MADSILPTAVILTALRVEYEAVRAHLTDIETLEHTSGTRAERGQLPGTSWYVALAEIGEGTLTAAALTERVNTWLAPQALFFVGVAGGLKDDIDIGDVVVATKIYAIHGGKQTPEGFFVRPEAWRSSHRLEQAARHALRGTEYQAHFKPIAVGDVVLADAESAIARHIHEHYNDAVAFEMEGAGVAQAAHLTGTLDTLIIRGISDKADKSKHERDAEGSQPKAARSAADAAIAVLQKLKPPYAAALDGEGRGSTLPSSPGWPARLGSQGLLIWTSELFAAGMADPDDTSEPPERDKANNVPGSLRQDDAVDAGLLQAGRLPYLQRQFESIGRQFDDWVAGCRQRRGEGKLKVFWIVGEPGPERSKALLAVVSRAQSAGRTVYDPGRNLDLASEVIAELGHAELPVEPALVPVDLPAPEPSNGWTKLREVRDGVRRRKSARKDPDPVLVVGGTAAQVQTAHGILQSSIEIEPFDVKGRPYPQLRVELRTERLESPSLSAEHIFNQGLPATAPQLFGREEELATLRDAWLSGETRIQSVVALGGVGKSALVNAWLREMRDRDYLGAEKVFAWSFYSQGTRENLVSAGTFVTSALKWLGDEAPPSQSPAVEGTRLAKLIREHHLLLILDGLEPLQYPETAPHVGGQIKDVSITALLRELAMPGWAGLCLITTRVPLTDDLTPRGRSAPATVAKLELGNLAPPTGAALLQSLIGRQDDVAAAEQAVRDVHGHALSVNLLGRYLRDVHAGQLSGRFELQNLTTAVADGGHAQRIMEKYAEWLEGDQRIGELAILSIIGLFDRPAPYTAIEAVLADTELGRSAPGLDEIGSAEWVQYVAKLREMGLLSSETAGLPDTLDAHPLVREHFRDRLQSKANDLWTTGNRALYSYYKHRAPELPDNAGDMSLLYAAVNHGCVIGLQQEVFDTVIEPRVWRDPREFFSTRVLGMTGSEVVALSNYFQMPSWTKLRKDTGLSPRAQLLVMSTAALRLRQLGRLDDARASCSEVDRAVELPAKEAAQTMAADASEKEIARHAAYASSLHCELQVIGGQLGPARESAKRAIRLADRCDDAYFKMYARSCLAEVDFMEGDFDEAGEWFAEAETVAWEQASNLPFLYSQNLYRYGYFAIETGGAARLLADAEQKPGWGLAGIKSSPLSRAIQKLILGAARRSQVEQDALGSEHLATASTLMDDAIVMFRGAGYTDYIVRGLLERAHLLRIRRQPEDYANALDDLDEAQAEITRGGMKLLAADESLERVACHLAFWPTATREHQAKVSASDTLAEAEQRVRSLQYWRRRPMLAELKRHARNYGTGWSSAQRKMSTTPRVAGSGDT